MLATADSHIDCASEKKGSTSASKKNSAAVAEKPEEAPKDKLFEDDEIDVVAPKAKERKAAKTGNKGSGIFTWTKKKFTDFMGDLYDGMEE
jgi:hypothetical protein